MNKFRLVSLVFVQAIFIMSCGVDKIEEPGITESADIVETYIELVSQEDIEENAVEESKFVLGELNVQLELKEPIIQGIDKSEVEENVEETFIDVESVSVETVNPDTTLGVSVPSVDDMIDYTCISKMEVNNEWIIIEQSNTDENKVFTLYMNNHNASSGVMENFEIVEISEKRVEYFYDSDKSNGIVLWVSDGINYTIEGRNIPEEEFQKIVELIVNKSI